MSGTPTEPLRCCASEDGQACRLPAVGVLVYDNRWGVRKQRGELIEHPLCAAHGRPSFHLRNIGSKTRWSWRPLPRAAQNGEAS